MLGLLGHTRIETTLRYPGVDFVDALTLLEGTGIRERRLIAGKAVSRLFDNRALIARCRPDHGPTGAISSRDC